MRRHWMFWAGFLAVVGFGGALALDREVYAHLFVVEPQIQDWQRLFRVGGYLPFWLLVALAWIFIDSAAIKRNGLQAALGRSLFLGSSVLLAGGLTEALKILIRRERPDIHAGYYVFRSWQDRPFDTAGLALPSGHAAIAFAATWVLCHLYPRATPVWLLYGVGCGLSRLLDRAHFLSDVYLSAVLTFAIVHLLWKRFAGLAQPPAEDHCGAVAKR
jgi:membrane-associated phospholipid phosphatase